MSKELFSVKKCPKCRKQNLIELKKDGKVYDFCVECDYKKEKPEAEK